MEINVIVTYVISESHDKLFCKYLARIGCAILRIDYILLYPTLNKFFIVITIMV